MDSAAADGPHSGSGPTANPLGHGPVLLLTGARLADGRVVDVRISGDRIQAVGTVGSLGPLPALPGAPTITTGARIDLKGYLLLPAPAEAHAHYDTAFSAALSAPPPESPSDLTRRVTEAALASLGYGATAQRTHVRIGDVHGLRRLEAVLTARQALRGLAELQAVAMPRLLTGRAGADGRAQLREALKLGATAAAAARSWTRIRPGTSRCCWRPPGRRTARWTCTPRPAIRPNSPGWSARWPRCGRG